MKAGRLRNRIELQRNTPVQDPNTGEAVLAWTTFATRWGSIEPMEGGEVKVAGAQEGKARSIVGMRFVDGLTAKDRLKIGDLILNIDSVQNVYTRDREMEVICWEQT